VPRSEPLVGAAAGQYQTAGVRVPTAVAMPNLQGKLLGAGLYVGCPRFEPAVTNCPRRAAFLVTVGPDWECEAGFDL